MVASEAAVTHVAFDTAEAHKVSGFWLAPREGYLDETRARLAMDTRSTLPVTVRGRAATIEMRAGRMLAGSRADSQPLIWRDVTSL